MKKLFVALLVSSVLMAGCMGLVRNEKQAFIDSTVEATCYLVNADNIFDSSVEAGTKEIYEKYGFPINDKAALDELTVKYKAMPEVIAEIEEGLENCSENFKEKLEEAIGDVEESAVEEEPLVQEEEMEEVTEDMETEEAPAEETE